MQPRTPRAAVAAASLLVSISAPAAEDGVSVSPVVVTATRTAQTADETVAPGHRDHAR
ncbi:MAG: hypothetical protein U5K43_10755 [Halofilum sp. (in: g-proteobacteria)]|nr:hypothetical protein [Halofilum sp. (in: g-proteobacteria)]